MIAFKKKKIKFNLRIKNIYLIKIYFFAIEYKTQFRHSIHSPILYRHFNTQIK